MKKILKGEEPALLANYKRLNPRNNWTQFRVSKPRRQAVKSSIRSQQGGLCAYCEIDLKIADLDSDDKDDFRVEHFHPKSDNSTTHNWNLDWANLLGCCHGGSNSEVTDADTRFTSPDNSCDVPKGDNNWDDEILNPLLLPESPALFSFSRSDGSMLVNATHCEAAKVDVVKAQQTINLLQLDSKRLRRLRKEVLNRVNAQLRSKVANGISLDDARNDLARGLLRKDNEGCWPSFFTAIRHYLGDAAERHLKSIDYKG